MVNSIQKRQRAADNRLMLCMLLPSVIFVLLITIFPLIYTSILSFQNYNLLSPQDAEFTGLKNYIKVFSDSLISKSILITFKYTIIAVVVSMILGLILALLAASITAGRTFFRIVLFIPMMLAPVVVGVLWKFLYNYDLGILNYILSRIGIDRINWLGSSNLSLTSVIIADIWQWTSYTFILCLAALEALNPEPIEAAKIDGASAVQTFFLVTLPSILPVLEVALVFRLVWAFRGFLTLFTP